MPLRTILSLLLSIIVLTCLPLPSRAQSVRFEVGLRLRALEAAWEQHGDNVEGRKRIVRPLFDAFRNFFALQWSMSAKNLDEARHLLRSAELPAAETRWAEALSLRPKKRLLDGSNKVLPVTLDYFYKVGVKTPKKAQVRIALKNDKQEELQPVLAKAISSFPLEIELPLMKIPEGDHVLYTEIIVNDAVRADSEQTISVVSDSTQRLAALQKAVDDLADKPHTTDTETAAELARLLKGLASGWDYETNYPAARLLAEAEAAVAAIRAGKPFYGKERTGQFWLRLRTQDSSNLARVFVPEEAKKGQPIPLVIALHGAGGSENLFFEAYGRGKIVDLCRQRGWLLAAPRSPNFAFRYPAAAIADALAERYPVDRAKILIIGHSMGAAQAVSAAQDTPNRFAAIAALGGSGRIRSTKEIKTVPFFVGVGTRDFALEGAQRLTGELKKGGVQTVQMREYEEVEHIMIVQEALADVFAFFDRVVK